MGKRYTRRQFLGAAGAGIAGAGLLGLAGCDSSQNASRAEDVRADEASTAQQGGVQTFRSSPDLKPPTIEISKSAQGTADGYVLAAAKNGPVGDHPSQHGPMILDDEGNLVWFRPVSGGEDAMDFRVQSYRGEPVLTWWQGMHEGWGQGEYLILDGSYREVARFGAGNGYAGDHHEFFITDRDTALIGIYAEVETDLSALGGPEDIVVMDGVVQEIEIATGEVLFEWHSLDHVGPEESYDELSPDLQGPLDYFHINSIDVDDDENLIISARRTSAVYKIDRESGDLIWRLGGKNSDFEMGEGARFAFQHDARRAPDGALTLFDNRGAEMDEPSRGIALDLDEETMEATLLREYVHPEEVFGVYQGNMQTLPNSNVFIGWGSAPYISEFSREGRLLFDARFPPEVESYRAYRSPWTGRPNEEPAIAVKDGEGEEATVYASYNGATELAEWEVLAGDGPEDLESVGSAPREGFETAIAARSAGPYMEVRAKDRSGRVIGAVSHPRG